MYTYSVAPGIVEIVDVVSISNTSAIVTWNPPIQPNGIITGYKVEHSLYEVSSDIISVSVASNINSLNMTELGKYNYDNTHSYS